MNNSIIYTFATVIIFACFSVSALGQSRVVTGKLIGDDKRQVQFASVVLQTPDSIYVEAVVADSTGSFAIKTEQRSYRLIIQHLLYETKEIHSSESDLGTIQMELKNAEIDEVVVRGERPFVRVEGGVLSYDVQQIREKKIVSSAYDAILELPGVREENSVITLAGASSVAVILNGRPSTMSYTQLIEMLKQMPVSNLKSAEVMYSAPPQYHVRGAAINLVTAGVDSKLERPNLQGEVRGTYDQRHYANYSSGISLLYSSKKLMADLLYSVADSEARSGLELQSRHNVQGTIRDVQIYDRSASQNLTHVGRLGVDYKPNENNLLNFVYNTSVRANGKLNSHSSGNTYESIRDGRNKNQFHNFAFDYISGFGFKAGVDYTYFESPSTQKLLNIESGGQESGYDSKSRQIINSFSIYADQVHKLKNGWSISYGGKFSFAKDHDYQIYDNAYNGMTLYDTDNTIKEYIIDFYAGVSKRFSPKLSMNLSLTGESYKLADDQEWTLFPQAQLTYLHSRENIVQFAFSSDKRYPTYWEKQDYKSYINGYAVVYGNPLLKPYNNYSMQLSYIRSQKYIFTFYYQYQKDYSVQLGYQDPNSFMFIYQTQNWDYNQRIGLNIVIPFKIWQWLDSRVILNGYYNLAKSDNFYDIGFNNEKFVGYVSLNNTITVSSKPNIRLNVSTYYITKPIQGIYDLSKVWGVDAGLKWIFAKEKCEFSVRAKDIFASSTPDVFVRSRGQNFDMFVDSDNRSVNFTFTYKFGGYKEKKTKQVDQSRFGH